VRNVGVKVAMFGGPSRNGFCRVHNYVAHGMSGCH